MGASLNSFPQGFRIMSLYSHLSCSWSGEQYRKDIIQSFSRMNKPLIAAYTYLKAPSKAILRGRPFSMWRYKEFLPVEKADNVVTLGEGFTPVSQCKRISGELEINLLLKDEANNPTGSFKARGISAAVSKARELGIESFVIPTAGNAGSALSAYCARAGLQARVFMPRKTPEIFKQECESYGAEVTIVDGNISDCAREIKRREIHAFDVSTLKEPYRLEGKKTMGFEIAEQLDWKLPDVIIYPTGGGTGLIGIWKAFREMKEMGWIKGKLPRMVAVQLDCCHPVVAAYRKGASDAEFFENAGESIANGLRVPFAFGANLILKALYESKGTALTVTDEEIRKGMNEFASREGVLLCPEGAATYAALKKLHSDRWIKPGESVLLLNTGSPYKYSENF